MDLFYIVLIVILSLIILNNLFLFFYCRIEEKFENKTRNKKKVDSKNNFGNSSNNVEKISFKRKLKKFLGKIYATSNHYLYGWMRYNILLLGKFPSHRLRNLMYRYVYNMKITKKTVIYGGCEIRSPWNIKADNCVISTYCILDGRRGITIGENVVFGSGVHIWTEEHDVNDPYFAVLEKNAQPVIIKDRAWICSDSTILPGTVINEGAVVASRACVTKDCESFTIYGGVPAKKIGERSKDLRYELNGKPHWHFY